MTCALRRSDARSVGRWFLGKVLSRDGLVPIFMNWEVEGLNRKGAKARRLEEVMCFRVTRSSEEDAVGRLALRRGASRGMGGAIGSAHPGSLRCGVA